MDNDSGAYFTLQSSTKTSWVQGFRWPHQAVWARRFPGHIDKTALGQGFLVLASRRKVYVFSSGLQSRRSIVATILVFDGKSLALAACLVDD